MEFRFSVDCDYPSKVDFLIIGGGVAGLSAALHLAENGGNTLLVEAGTYPAHRVCGEFLSPECLPLLRHFGIEPSCCIRRARFCVGERSFDYPLAFPAGSMARLRLDALLAERLRQRGGAVLTGTRAMDLRVPLGADAPFFARLSGGQEVEASALIMGTGRFVGEAFHHKPPKSCYAGLKAHVRGLQLDDMLEMHVLPHAYAGLSMVDSETANIALLARWKAGAPPGDPSCFLEGAPQLSERLAACELVFPEWLSVCAPEFGPRTTPEWPNAYFIGDAAGVIPPACGDGLAMALTSGELAASFAELGDWKGFRCAWKQRYRRRLRWGMWLHRVMSHPALARRMLHLLTRWPSLADAFYEKTRT